jgi:NADH-quinone oxidoreductase subunit J
MPGAVNTIFLLASAVALAATVMVITRRSAVHALLYLVVSLFAVAVVMLLLGAAFVAALEIIVYAGAIMVLFVFVIMMIGPESAALELRAWVGPVILGLILLAELVYVFLRSPGAATPAVEVPPKQVGITLLGPYVVGAEVTAFLLLAGLVGAYHLGRRRR